MSRHKPLIAFILFLVFLVLLGNLYAFKIEPKRVTTRTYTLSNNKISDVFQNYKIAFFSDLDVYDEASFQQLKRTVKTINQGNYDLVVFGGDLFFQAVYEPDLVVEQLKSLQSKSGKYAILGEKDIPVAIDVESILFRADFEVLNNHAHRVKVGDRYLTLVGLQYAQDTQPLLTEAMLGDPIITFIHMPDSFIEMNPYPFDLQVSGHSYGGFVAIPFFRFYQSEGAHKYIRGSYELNDKRLLVSNGIGGTAIKNYRFLAPPQVTVIKLVAPKVIITE